MSKENYVVKVDDMLLYLLKEYHNIDASDAMVFFDDRVKEMRDLPPNINEKSHRTNLSFNGQDKRTGHSRYAGQKYKRDDSAKFYVLRGFFPDTNLPFKMVVVYTTDKPGTWGPSGCMRYKPSSIAHVKVIMGMKPHWTVISSSSISNYKDHMTEAILLDQPAMDSEKINYKYRNFKCMRPKGMDLYRERNYADKVREQNRISAKKRRGKKNDK